MESLAHRRHGNLDGDYGCQHNKYCLPRSDQGFQCRTDGAYVSELAIPLAFHDVLLLSIFINVIVLILCLLPLWIKQVKPVQG